MADALEERRREHFEGEFKRFKKPSNLTGWMLFIREGQLEYAPKEDWGGYIRSETEYCYNLWREEIEKMKAAKEEGNVYEINYTHIWGNPYN